MGAAWPIPQVNGLAAGLRVQPAPGLGAGGTVGLSRVRRRAPAQRACLASPTVAALLVGQGPCLDGRRSLGRWGRPEFAGTHGRWPV